MSTANLRIVPKNDYDDAALTVSATEAVGFEVANTQNTIRDKTWRTTSNASQSITGVWSASRMVSHVSLHRHLCHAGSWRVQLFSDAGASVQVLDATGGAVSATSYSASEPYTWSEGSNDPFLSRSSTWKWFAETAARSFKITFSGTPSQSFWQVSRIWIGRYMELARSAAYGTLQFGQDNNTDRERTQGGSLRRNEGELWRKLTFDLNGINENEFATWVDVRENIGTSKDVVISAYPGDGNRREALHMLAGPFANLNDIGRPSQVMSMRVQVEEN